MSINRRPRRRSLPNEELLGGPVTLDDYRAPGAQDDAEEDPRNEMEFFDHLRALTPAECEKNLVYLYRQDPPIENSEGNKKYISKYTPPLDEEMIKKDHGGGKYLAYLKNTEAGTTVRKAAFRIDGPPILPPGTVVLDGQSGKPVQPAAPQPSLENTITEVVKALTPLISKPDVSQDELLNSVVSAMRKANEISMEIMGSSAKKQAESTTGSPLLDTVLTKALSRMVEPPPQTNPLGDFKTMLETFRELQGLTGGQQQPSRRGSLLEEMQGLAEILKGADGSLRDLIFNREPAEPPSLSSMLLSVTSAILQRRPDIIDSGAALLARVASGSSAQPATLTGAPAQPGPPAAHTPAVAVPPPPIASAVMPEAAPTRAPQPAQTQASVEEQLIAGLLQAVARGYLGQNSGDGVAISLQVLFPQETAMLAHYLQMPDEAVLGWLRTQPAIAAIVDQDDFPQFYADFKQQVLNPRACEDEGEEGEDGVS